MVKSDDSYYNYQLTKVWWPAFNVQLVLLSWKTGFVSSGNLSASDAIGSKAREIAGDDIVTIGNEESCP